MTVKGRAHLIGSSDAGRRSSQAGAAIRSHWQGHAAWLEAEGGRICGRDPLHGVPVDRGGVAALSEGRLEIEGLGCRSAIAQALESRHGLLPIRGAICLDQRFSTNQSEARLSASPVSIRLLCLGVAETSKRPGNFCRCERRGEIERDRPTPRPRIAGSRRSPRDARRDHGNSRNNRPRNGHGACP
jgi:hypothetical protein